MFRFDLDAEIHVEGVIRELIPYQNLHALSEVIFVSRLLLLATELTVWLLSHYKIRLHSNYNGPTLIVRFFNLSHIIIILVPIMASFDVEDHFRQYLATIDPNQTYAIKQLTGGLVNYTVRATKVLADGGDHRLSRFPGHDSIIIKHAPPFIAAIGEAAKFSPFRQVCPIPASIEMTRPMYKPLWHIENGTEYWRRPKLALEQLRMTSQCVSYYRALKR